MKRLTTLIILTATTFGCDENQKLNDEVKAEIYNEDIDSLTIFGASKEQKDSIFNSILEFPKTKDTTEFIANLRLFYELEVDESCQKENEKITTYQKVKIFGSEKEYVFVEYDYGNGCAAAFPWKHQLLLTHEGILVESLSALRYEFLEIFKNEPPLLLTVNASAKGNGSHSIFKVTADTLENILDNELPYYLRTYDAHHDNRVNEPHEFLYNVKDWNNDGINDISFHGKFVLIQGLSENGVWYDKEIINGKEIIYSIDNPFKKVDVELVFLFDKNTNHFKAKEDYSNKYELYK